MEAAEKRDELRYCYHCHEKFSDDDYIAHLPVIDSWEAERRTRGGIWVEVDGDELWAPSVMQIQAEGIYINVKHHRLPTVRTPPSLARLGLVRRMARYDEPSSHGGSTDVLLLAPDGYWARGRSVCHKRDVFSKKAGYVLAVDRALSELPGRYYAFDGDLQEKIRRAAEN